MIIYAYSILIYFIQVTKNVSADAYMCVLWSVPEITQATCLLKI
jgi:hypothetical protein